MASIDLLYETFDLYYKKAKSCYEKGDLFLAKKYYLLAAEQMLKLAKESKDELQNARYKRAKSILAFAESIHVDKKHASETIENEKLPEPSAVKISLEEALNKLYSLEGLSKVKEQVGVWVNQIKTFRLRQERGLPVPEEFTYHLVFRGRAGTGKTTVARLMAQIYGALGILSKGHLVEVHARDLVAGYVGQTAIRTKEYIQQASGGVLFIDEAYYLAQGGANDFGQEAIGVLLKRMEDNRGDFVVIVAGYEDTMDDFISSNSGLKSRFSNFIDFEDYTGAELFNIFKKLCDKYKYEMDYPVQIALQNYFNKLYLNRGKDYANGRDARNLFEKIVSYNSNYVATLQNPSDKELNLITLSQLPEYIAKYYKNESQNNQDLSKDQDIPVEQNQQDNHIVNNLNIDNKKQEDTVNENDKSVAGTTENNSKKVFEKINVLGSALRPQRLDDFIGQPKAVETLRMPIEKSRLTGNVLPHILLCASYGQGKTTLAKIIANEVEGNFIEVVAGIKYRDMLRTLSDIKKGDIVFIDEIHKLSTDVIEQLLYPAMEDFEIHYTEENGAHLINKTKKINPFTLIGATTETGSLLKPFYSKFKINCTLEEYSLDTIVAIIINSFRHSGLDITVDLAEKIAKRCRLSPRQANAFVEGISSRAIVEAARKKGINKAGALSSFEAIKSLSIQVNEKDIDDYFATMRIDDRGLKEEELKILRLITIDYKGGPIGVENIAKAMNMAVNRISNEYEPMLIKLGLLGIKNGGRYATDAAYSYLGLTRESNKLNSDELSGNNVYSDLTNANNDINANGEDSVDDLMEYSCNIGTFDKNAAERFNMLFSGASKVFDEPLDNLFSDVSKSYESTALNKCLLKVGERTIYCDSKLERRFLSYLFEKGFIIDAKSESLELIYSSALAEGKRYYPDFCLKLYDGTIAIVEMKNFGSMGYHLNIDKYEALQSYCNEHGYKYAEIAKDYDDKRYISAEYIKALPINEKLRAFIITQIDKNGICNFNDLQEFGFDIKELVTILLNDRTLKNIDKFGSEPQIIYSNQNI